MCEPRTLTELVGEPVRGCRTTAVIGRYDDPEAFDAETSMQITARCGPR